MAHYIGNEGADALMKLKDSQIRGLAKYLNLVGLVQGADKEEHVESFDRVARAEDLDISKFWHELLGRHGIKRPESNKSTPQPCQECRLFDFKENEWKLIKKRIREV